MDISIDGVKLESELEGYTTIRKKVYIVFLNKSWPFFFFFFFILETYMTKRKFVEK